MFGFNSQKKTRKPVKAKINDIVYVDRPEAPRSLQSLYRFKIILIEHDVKPIYHLLSQDVEGVIIRLNPALSSATIIDGSGPKEIRWPAMYNSVKGTSNDMATFDFDFSIVFSKESKETVFRPVEVGDVLHKDTKDYTVLAISGDHSLFVQNEKGQGFIVSKRDLCGYSAFGLSIM